MSDNRIAKAEDFRAALEHSNVEQVSFPASGLAVLLCRPPVFAALAMGRTGTQLQARVTDAKPEEIKTEDIESVYAMARRDAGAIVRAAALCRGSNSGRNRPGRYS